MLFFSGFALNNVTSDFSQIYVIRKKSKKLTAYHLDITNPGRISLASKFEMRPDDIVFVATQPLSLYSRTLSQILGSTGLTLQGQRHNKKRNWKLTETNARVYCMISLLRGVVISRSLFTFFLYIYY